MRINTTILVVNTFFIPFHVENDGAYNDATSTSIDDFSSRTLAPLSGAPTKEENLFPWKETKNTSHSDAPPIPTRDPWLFSLTTTPILQTHWPSVQGIYYLCLWQVRLRNNFLTYESRIFLYVTVGHRLVAFMKVAFLPGLKKIKSKLRYTHGVTLMKRVAGSSLQVSDWTIQLRNGGEPREVPISFAFSHIDLCKKSLCAKSEGTVPQ